MAIPDYQTLMRPVLVSASNGPIPIKQCVEEISNHFNLSSEEREELIPSGKQATIANRVHWASTYMVKAGLLERPKRGIIQATERGKLVLQQHPERIDNAVLLKFKEFRAFREHSKIDTGHSTQIGALLPAESEATPEERIDNAFQEMNVALRDELLTRIMNSEPVFFEQLIIDLMLAMGYGGSGSSQHLGKSHDGGIDGIINEDPLGLDIVFLQAKRYAPGNVIGVDKIREFAGSLDEKGAVKGVFVTTSHFAQQAKVYAERSPKRLILIDGEELSRLMVRYGVGVRAFRTVELKKIDLDYFNVDE
jgi:restriction system protein